RGLRRRRAAREPRGFRRQRRQRRGRRVVGRARTERDERLHVPRVTHGSQSICDRAAPGGGRYRTATRFGGGRGGKGRRGRRGGGGRRSGGWRGTGGAESRS